MKHVRLSAVLATALLVAACNNGTDGNTDGTDGLSSSSASSIRETRNVSYTGTVQPAGISVYQEGTHRLLIEGGRFILLESDDVDLNGYVGEEVSVVGSTRPTVEAGGTIMRVDTITLNGSSSSSSLSSSAQSSSSSSRAASVASSLASTPIVVSSSSVTSVAPASSSVATSEATGTSADLEAQITAMAAEDISAGRWTQTYCTTHIGFCIPVHRNWWYLSFGNTTSHLWHVEISTKEISSIGDGAVVVKLVSGGIASVGVTDGQVRDQGGQAIGYRAYDDTRHFEVVADARLRAIVSHITTNLTLTETEE